LIQAAQSLLAEQGAESLSTRRVSAQAGVTTGAIYRRYDGKGALLADVLLVALAPDRYEWTWELVAALASDDPYRAAADVMTAQLLAASRTEAEQRVDGGGRQAWSIFTLTLRPRIVQ
jgi:AcrR family transcriptional regulator